MQRTMSSAWGRAAQFEFGNWELCFCAAWPYQHSVNDDDAFHLACMQLLPRSHLYKFQTLLPSIYPVYLVPTTFLSTLHGP